MKGTSMGKTAFPVSDNTPEWDDLMKRRGWLFIPDYMMQTFWQGIQANPNWQIVIDAIERLPHKDGCDISGCSWLFEPLSDKEGAPEYLIEITEDDNGKVIAVRAERFTLSPLKEKTDESILLDTVQTNIGTLEVYAGAMPKTPDAPKPGAVVHCEPVSPSDGDGDDFIRACYDRDAMMQQILNNTKERIVMSQELVVMSQELGMYYYRDKVDKQAPDPKTESFAEALAAANRKVGC